ncbi:hypothetical protein C8F01DRAFT_1329961 [Mycena amicta]|nr:hypothetical protein C8F01DRAFT_1329961 [Mycena amicta]
MPTAGLQPNGRYWCTCQSKCGEAGAEKDRKTYNRHQKRDAELAASLRQSALPPTALRVAGPSNWQHEQEAGSGEEEDENANLDGLGEDDEEDMQMPPSGLGFNDYDMDEYDMDHDDGAYRGNFDEDDELDDYEHPGRMFPSLGDGSERQEYDSDHDSDRERRLRSPSLSNENRTPSPSIQDHYSPLQSDHDDHDDRDDHDNRDDHDERDDPNDRDDPNERDERESSRPFARSSAHRQSKSP